ncbi:non-ribosomal peptide synthetase [Kitasatospora cineracea]|uniref:Amino acid adenylation domain-containing protein n=1 Tax=Kitasatospora cineracea TaxID=88074 RepID=A0A8G1UGJ6_9ACTN|nr:non-ribosomal peptide synthetase [Kitasatospora cineracea]ROR38129.1 amino acid adenylation domain-containing protein [Kitasatospora cineracea]
MNENENTPATADALRRELIAKRLAGRKTAAAGGAVGGRMERVERGGALPASFAQERLWLLDRLSASGDEYLLKYVWRVRGRLDRSAWQQALDDVVARHEVLRTALIEVDGRPVQRIADHATVPTQWHDLTTTPATAEQRLDHARDLATAFSTRPFDLATAPLLRCAAWTLDTDDHLVTVTFHHVASDGWSAKIFTDELTTCYEARTTHTTPTLPALPVQYADFASWQRNHLTGQVLDDQLAHWRTALADLTTLDLPTDHPRPTTRTGRGATITHTLPTTLITQLETLARTHRATTFMVLLAAFHTVLARWSGQTDIAIGTPIAGRNRAETEGLIGFFVNTLVTRTDLTDNPTFATHLTRVRDNVLNAFDHQDLPFERLVEDLKPPRDPSRNPLFQAWFVTQNFEQAEAHHGSIQLSPMSLDSGDPSSPFDISLITRPVEGGMRFHFTYARDLFDADSVERLASHLRRLLETVALTPDVPVGSVDLLTDEERRALTVLSAPVEAAGEPPSVLEAFAAQVARDPDAVAVVCGEQHLTYRELADRSDALADALHATGVGPESRVGVCLERSPWLPVALLGIWKAGGAYVPLDPAYPHARLTHMAQDADLTCIVTQHHLADLATSLHTTPVLVEDLPATGTRTPHPPAGNTLAYLIYTSGSTGRPKGVAVDHPALTRHTHTIREHYRLTPHDRVLQFASYSFDPFLEQLLPALLSGARVVIRPNDPWLPTHLPSVIEQFGVTVANFPPAYWAEMVSGLSAAQVPAMATLRLLVLGGEVLPPAALAVWQQHLPGVTVVNAYGPTETTVTATAHTVRGDTPGKVPIGTALGGRRTYVLDPHGNPTPLGIPGELCIGGPELARGYHHQPALTADRFTPDPHGPAGSRIYHTGDRVRRLPDGTLHYLGRLDNQIKLRGHRIELDEIQTTLTNHPHITTAITTIREDRPGHPHLTAHYTTTDTTPLTTTTLRTWCTTTLPDHMIPTHFIHLTTLPTTPTGKIDHKALPAPTTDRTTTDTDYTAPRNPTEQTIADIWAEVLGTTVVGIDDNFFELGGHSLLATMAVSRIAEQLNRSVELRTIFEKPCIREFAEQVAAAGGAVGGRMERVERGGALPASFAQERLWLLDRLSTTRDEYTLSHVWRVRGRLDRSAWQQALDDVVARHEVLRTALIEVDGRPVQRIADHATVPTQWHDLTTTPATAEQRLDHARDLATAFSTRPFDLATAPLLRCAAWTLDTDDHLVTVTFHHVASDGWSAKIFTDELTAHYEARTTHTTPTLPTLPVQYADFASWQRNHLTGQVLDDQLAHWRTALADLTTLDLPTDHPRPTTRTGRGATITHTLPTTLITQLETLARTHRATTFMVLLAAFHTVLARWSGQTDIAIGTPIAGRNRAETEGLIGFFVNTLVTRTDLTDNPTFTTHLTRVRDNVLNAFDHQDLPFERLVEDLKPPRDPSRNPLFQVLFDVNDRPATRVTAAGAEFTPVDLPRNTAKFDLSLSFGTGREGRFSLHVEYATDLFDRATVLRLASHVESVLTEIAHSPRTRVGDLRMLSEEERKSVEALSAPVEVAGEPPSVLEAFAAQVARDPDAVAVVCGEQHLTYRELADRSDALADTLHATGVRPESRVGVCLERSPWLPVALLGIWKAGGAYVPLDPAYPHARLTHMAQDAALTCIVTQHELADLATSLHRTPVLVEDLPATGTHTPHPPAGNTLAYIIYTSGSTGRPKGVAVDHPALARHTHTIREHYRLTPHDRVLQFASYSFDAALEQTLPGLTAGARVVIRPDQMWTIEELREQIHTHGITVMELVPTYWAEFAAGLTPASRNPLATLRLVITGGEVLPPAPTDAWFTHLPHIPVVNTYGPTETAIAATAHTVRRRTADRIPIGIALGSRRTYVLDPHGNPTPLGIPGELCIGGPELARGYHHQPALTADRFTPDPHGPAGSRIYHTGDRVRRLPDGTLHYLGRLDNQIKLRGHRIELDEIQTTLTNHPHITTAITTIREDRPGHPHLTAHYTTTDTTPLTTTTLRTWCTTTLPDHMIPTHFIHLTTLPTTPTGKIDHKALPAPTTDEGAKSTSFVEPGTPTEDVIASIWSVALGIDRVGVEDNFFELGGHSLRATVVASRMRQAFDCPVQVRHVFENPTVAALAVTVEQLLIDEIAAMSGDEIDLSLHLHLQ